MVKKRVFQLCHVSSQPVFLYVNLFGIRLYKVGTLVSFFNYYLNFSVIIPVFKAYGNRLLRGFRKSVFLNIINPHAFLYNYVCCFCPFLHFLIHIHHLKLSRSGSHSLLNLQRAIKFSRFVLIILC